MKKLVGLFCFILSSHFVMSQEFQNNTIKVEGDERPAVEKIVNETSDDVIDALEDYFKSKGSRKVKKTKGVYTAKNVKIDELNPDELDIFYTVESIGKRKNKQTQILLAVHTSKAQFVGEGTHNQIIQNLPAFMDKLPTFVSDYKKRVEAERLQKEAEAAKKEKERLEKKAAKQAEKAAKLQKQAEEASKQ